MTTSRENPQVKVCLLEGAGCGGCTVQAHAALWTQYEALRRGCIPVETPAHADVLLICGPLPTQLDEEIQRLGQTVAEPWACVHLGECAVEEILDGHLVVLLPKCPPSPEEILTAVRAAWKERSRPALKKAKLAAEEDKCS